MYLKLNKIIKYISGLSFSLHSILQLMLYIKSKQMLSQGYLHQ